MVFTHLGIVAENNKTYISFGDFSLIVRIILSTSSLKPSLSI
jgi:hypothetical protein